MQQIQYTFKQHGIYIQTNIFVCTKILHDDCIIHFWYAGKNGLIGVSYSYLSTLRTVNDIVSPQSRVTECAKHYRLEKIKEFSCWHLLSPINNALHEKGQNTRVKWQVRSHMCHLLNCGPFPELVNTLMCVYIHLMNSGQSCGLHQAKALRLTIVWN